MKKLIILAAFLFLLACSARTSLAQYGTVGFFKSYGNRTSDPATCNDAVGSLYYNKTSKKFLACAATNTWSILGLGSVFTSVQGAITADAPYINHTATWNNAGVTFTGFKSNVTDTASGANSLLADFRVNNVSQFSVGKAGSVTATGNINGANLGGIGIYFPATGAYYTRLTSATGGVVQSFDGLGRGGTFASTPYTPAQITANQNDYAVPGSPKYVRLSTDASRNITGIIFNSILVAGEEHILANVGAFNIVLTNQDALSVAANRFLITPAGNITLAPDEMARIWYDDVTTRWRAVKL